MAPDTRSKMRPLIPYAAALAGVVAMSGTIGLVRSIASIGHVSIVYLIVVLAVAVRFGRGAAIFASVAAFLTYDFFFTTPYHEFTISDPDEWISLTLFFITALITGSVAANERSRAEEARRREREAILLFDVLRLMGQPDLGGSLQALAERVRSELRVEAVGIEVEIGGEVRAAVAGKSEAAALVARGPTPTDVMPGVREPTASSAGRPRPWVRVLPPRGAPGYEIRGAWRRYAVPVLVGDRTAGRITLLCVAQASGFGAIDDRLLAVIATQLALLVQRAELELAATEAEVLRRASGLRTALLNAVSHELRTPLASILASAGSLLQREVGWSAEDRDGFASDIEQQAQRLDRVVGDLLDLSRIEAGAVHPEKDLHDLVSLIDGVVGRLGERAAMHRILVRRPEADLPPVAVDAVEIEQVLANLIENALKYAPPGSDIEVTARREGAEVVVEVADRGPGVPVSSAPYVFEPFYRVRGIAGPRPSGLGLGLAVAKGLVAAHGGRIWVADREGGGARFGFALPVAVPSASDVGAAAAVA